MSLALPVAMRAELKAPLGHLLTGDPSETVPKLEQILKAKNPPMFAVVGDYTSKNILEAGLAPDIVVVDYRVMRKDVDPLNHGDRQVLRVNNPRGTINSEAITALREAVTLKSKTSVIVEGEEDHLVLPLISLMPLGSVIVYGQPREGMVIVEVSQEKKGWVEAFTARMEVC